jgi:hypothetical protein
VDSENVEVHFGMNQYRDTWTGDDAMTARHVTSHLFYMDELKLYTSTEHQLDQLLSITETSSKDIQMSFGTDKCQTQCMQRNKSQLHKFQLEDGGTIEPMQEGDTFKYLGFQQSCLIAHYKANQDLITIYTGKLTFILKRKLSGKNLIETINTYAILS